MGYCNGWEGGGEGRSWDNVMAGKEEGGGAPSQGGVPSSRPPALSPASQVTPLPPARRASHPRAGPPTRRASHAPSQRRASAPAPPSSSPRPQQPPHTRTHARTPSPPWVGQSNLPRTPARCTPPHPTLPHLGGAAGHLHVQVLALVRVVRLPHVVEEAVLLRRPSRLAGRGGGNGGGTGLWRVAGGAHGGLGGETWLREKA